VIPVSATRKARPVGSRIAAQIAVWQRELSDRVHRDGDALARSHGWAITKTVGRFGFGGRIYRDPRLAGHRWTAEASTTRSSTSPRHACRNYRRPRGSYG
jgi:hypothetical protein